MPAGDGFSPLAPYDAIYVGGSCAQIPQALVEQLRPGGRLLLCVGEADAPQELTLVERLDTNEPGRRAKVRMTVLQHGLMMYGLR